MERRAALSGYYVCGGSHSGDCCGLKPLRPMVADGSGTTASMSISPPALSLQPALPGAQPSVQELAAQLEMSMDMLHHEALKMTLSAVDAHGAARFERELAALRGVAGDSAEDGDTVGGVVVGAEAVGAAAGSAAADKALGLLAAAREMDCALDVTRRGLQDGMATGRLEVLMPALDRAHALGLKHYEYPAARAHAVAVEALLARAHAALDHVDEAELRAVDTEASFMRLQCDEVHSHACVHSAVEKASCKQLHGQSEESGGARGAVVVVLSARTLARGVASWQ